MRRRVLEMCIGCFCNQLLVWLICTIQICKKRHNQFLRNDKIFCPERINKCLIIGYRSEKAKAKQIKDQSLLSSAFEELKPTWHHLLSPETVSLTSPLTAFACFLPCLSYPCPPLCLPFAPSRQGLVCLDGHLESWDLRENRVNIHTVPHDAGSGGRWPDRGHLVCCTKMHNFLFQLLWDVKGSG